MINVGAMPYIPCKHYQTTVSITSTNRYTVGHQQRVRVRAHDLHSRRVVFVSIHHDEGDIDNRVHDGGFDDNFNDAAICLEVIAGPHDARENEDGAKAVRDYDH